ncbi:hypothetical protein O6H91_13G067100 [Diphasiastrum complanatum]|nr:hypothetical protein O6H91_13G067100 [Diphasiastrum complanatum]
MAIETPALIPEQPSNEDIQAAYLALNQVTPFVRFAHLTANQAILEALENEDMAHIVDLDIKQGVQWPPLMQALAERTRGPPRLRISGIGASMDELEQTGMRLAEFARSLNLPFEFNAVARRIDDFPAAESLRLEMGEVVAVNCTLQLHRLLHLGSDSLSYVLEMIKALQPKVVAIAEKEASNNQSSFVDRLKEAFCYYSAIFDSLEATLPASSSERLKIEQVMLGREIVNIVACEDSQRMERHENFVRWKEFMEKTGFSAVAPSTFAVAQAKLLLRLHYPAEGYKLFEHEDSLFLGWQDRPLLAVSSWHGCSAS